MAVVFTTYVVCKSRRLKVLMAPIFSGAFTFSCTHCDAFPDCSDATVTDVTVREFVKLVIGVPGENWVSRYTFEFCGATEALLSRCTYTCSQPTINPTESGSCTWNSCTR